MLRDSLEKIARITTKPSKEEESHRRAQSAALWSLIMPGGLGGAIGGASAAKKDRGLSNALAAGGGGLAGTAAGLELAKLLAKKVSPATLARLNPMRIPIAGPVGSALGTYAAMRAIGKLQD